MMFGLRTVRFQQQLKVSFFPDAIESRIGSKIIDVLVALLQSFGEPLLGEFFFTVESIAAVTLAAAGK